MTTSQKAARLGEESVSPPQFLAVANPCGNLVFGSEYNVVCDVLVQLGLVLTVALSDRTRVDKVNAELVTLTYGTIVAQLCNDLDHNYVAVNSELEKMGYNIGMRLIEDFLARSGTGRCSSFRDTAEVISKVQRALARIE